MAKLLVKDPKTGLERPMTQKSYDAAAKKRGWKIVGTVHETGGMSEIEKHMERLRAEKAAKEAGNEAGLAHIPVINNAEDADQEQEEHPKQRQKPGPKPKAKAE
jgi:hypothetical protein